MSKDSKITASELVLSAVFFLQHKNGVTAQDIVKFICDKRNCKESQVRREIRKTLERATKKGIFTKTRGLYRIKSGLGERRVPRKVRQTSKAKKSNMSGKNKSPNSGDWTSGKMFIENKIVKAANPGTNDLGNDLYFCPTESLSNNVPVSDADDPSHAHSKVNFSVLQFKLKENDDDEDDEDFFEEDEDEDDDLDFFSDDDGFINPLIKQNPEPDKKKPNIVKKKTKSRDKSRIKNRSRKRKSSKPRKKYSKRRKTARSEHKKQDDSDDEEESENCEKECEEKFEEKGELDQNPEEGDADDDDDDDDEEDDVKAKTVKGRRGEHRNEANHQANQGGTNKKSHRDEGSENDNGDEFCYDNAIDGEDEGNEDERKRQKVFNPQEQNREGQYKTVNDSKEGAQIKGEEVCEKDRTSANATVVNANNDGNPDANNKSGIKNAVEHETSLSPNQKSLIQEGTASEQGDHGKKSKRERSSSLFRSFKNTTDKGKPTSELKSFKHRKFN